MGYAANQPELYRSAAVTALLARADEVIE